MPKLSSITRPSGASTNTHISGLPKMAWPNGVSASPAPVSRDRGGEREPGDQSGQRNAGSHVVVDADHVRAQTRIDRYLIRAIAGSGGRDIPVEVRHGNNP